MTRYPAYTLEMARQADASILRHMRIIDLAYPSANGTPRETTDADGWLTGEEW